METVVAEIYQEPQGDGGKEVELNIEQPVLIRKGIEWEGNQPGE